MIGFGRVAQVGFGAFPLAAAIFVAVCAFSARTLRAGLVFVLILDLTALAVHGVELLSQFQQYQTLIYGVLMIAVILLLPNGLMAIRATTKESRA